MVICPNCRNRIAAWKLMVLTNWNSVTCPTCSTRLQIKNKTVSSLIGGVGGGIGGGIGGLLGGLWLITGEMFYVMLWLPLFGFIFFASWLASNKYVELTRKDVGKQL
ncbi:MAG: hypothetical protein IBV52_08920 [Candidatus Bathyarchaeota archaeon]